MDALDCYGMVRLARHEMFGRPEMPLCAPAQPGRYREITHAVAEVSEALRLAPVPEPRPGAVATGWMAGLCVHVGLVVNADGRMRVLETDEKGGARLTRIRDFETRHAEVIYYDD